MKPSNVTQLAMWLDTTEYDLFRLAFKWRFDTTGCVDDCFASYALYGQVPAFVSLFITSVIYPTRIVTGGYHESGTYCGNNNTTGVR